MFREIKNCKEEILHEVNKASMSGHIFVIFMNLDPDRRTVTVPSMEERGLTKSARKLYRLTFALTVSSLICLNVGGHGILGRVLILFDIL